MAVHFETRPSQIPGAGNGCFALSDMKAGTTIGIYRGELLSEEELNRRFGSNWPSTCLQLPCGTVILPRAEDANHCHMINDGFVSGYNVNVIFCQDARMELCDDVKAGDELLTVYGDSYWFNDNTPLPGQNRLSSVDRASKPPYSTSDSENDPSYEGEGDEEESDEDEMDSEEECT